MVRYSVNIAPTTPVAFCVNEQWFQVPSDVVQEIRRMIGISRSNSEVVELMRKHGLPEKRIGHFICFTRKGGTPRFVE